MSLFKRLGGSSGTAEAEAEKKPNEQKAAVSAKKEAPAEAAKPSNGQEPVAATPDASPPEKYGPDANIVIPDERTIPPIGSERFQELIVISMQIVDRIQASLGTQSNLEKNPETEKMLRERFAHFLRNSPYSDISDDEAKDLFRLVYDEMLGFGPLQQLIDTNDVSEIMINGPNRVYIEKKGRLQVSHVIFANNDHLLKIIDRIIRPLGRRIDRKWPLVDARLPDGSRVNAVIPPCAIDGSVITIRKFSKNKLKVMDLVNFGAFSKEMASFLEAIVVARRNIIISGGTGSGKTTLINCLSNFIPTHERVVTIEDSAELQLIQDHVVRLEAKPADVDGTGRVAIRDLVINALRMRPERIIIGECRGGETLDLLQAMNTGHDGSMSTLHSNSPREAIGRTETMCMMAGMDLPLIVIRKTISAAVHFYIQQSRLDDGQRKVTYVTEVQGMEGDTVVLTDIFKNEILGRKPDGKLICEHRPTGVRPKCTPMLETAGFKLPPSVFGIKGV
jgi:pilus assembly protein CpaF